MLYKPATISSVLKEVDEEIAERLAAKPVVPMQEQVPSLKALLSDKDNVYHIPHGVAKVCTAYRSPRKGIERSSDK